MEKTLNTNSKEIVPSYYNPNEQVSGNHKGKHTYNVEKELARQQLKLAQIELASARQSN